MYILNIFTGNASNNLRQFNGYIESVQWQASVFILSHTLSSTSDKYPLKFYLKNRDYSVLF